MRPLARLKIQLQNKTSNNYTAWHKIFKTAYKILHNTHTESIFLLSNEEPFETTRNFPATIIVSLILGNSLLVKRGPSIKVWEIKTIAKQSNLAFFRESRKL